MADIAIAGAGELGGLVAHVLARRNVARAIALIDEKGRIAEGKALDIAQAAPIERFATQLSGRTDASFAAGASVIAIADQSDGTEWQGEPALMLIRRLREISRGSLLVCAGASQREIIELAAHELHVPRERVFGSAPEALAAAARAIVALEANASPMNVALTVLGVPPDHVVIPWEDATVGGFALTRVLDEPARRRIGARVAALWPPGPYALASAAAKVIEAVLGRSHHLATCFVASDGSAGARTRTAALPVRLGPRGVDSVILPTLTAREQVLLENAMML